MLRLQETFSPYKHTIQATSSKYYIYGSRPIKDCHSIRHKRLEAPPPLMVIATLSKIVFIWHLIPWCKKELVS